MGFPTDILQLYLAFKPSQIPKCLHACLEREPPVLGLSLCNVTNVRIGILRGRTR